MGRDFRSFITLTAGAFFGEIALLIHNLNRRAGEFFDLSSLVKDAFKRTSPSGWTTWF